MQFFTNLLLLALGIAYVAAAPTKKEILSTTSRLTTAQLLDLRRRVQGCNANVCFAIDGSASIDKENFEAQKNFILDVTAVIADGTNPVELAAVQYGTSTSAISRLTLDPERFNTAVVNTPQLRSDSTFVAGGISFCFGQLFRRRDEANKIVLLGSGKSTIGASAVARADLFRSLGGNVCTVGAGFTDDSELLAIAGGDPARVFQVDNFIDVLDLQFIIEDIVFDICSNVPVVSTPPRYSYREVHAEESSRMNEWKA